MGSLLSVCVLYQRGRNGGGTTPTWGKEQAYNMNKIDKLKELAKEYVQTEASTNVKTVEYIQTFRALDKEAIVLAVDTTEGNFWVVGGEFPMNLYDRNKFRSADEAFSFHLGSMLRISERQWKEEGSKLLDQNLEPFQSPKEIVEFIKNRTCYFFPSWEWREDILFEITPKQFLEYAEKAIEEGGEAGYINALSNIKRTIDCQLDLLVYILGQFKKAKKENWKFPRKIEFMRTSGLVAPEILTKINRKRNELEHEYKCPATEEVKDALDIANLFLASTNRFVERKYLGFGTELNRGQLWINFDQDRNLFEIEILDPPSKTVVDDKDENFLSLLRIYVQFMIKL